MSIFFHENSDKTRIKYSKSAIFVWHENDCRRLFGAQSINTERVTLTIEYSSRVLAIGTRFRVTRKVKQNMTKFKATFSHGLKIHLFCGLSYFPRRLLGNPQQGYINERYGVTETCAHDKTVHPSPNNNRQIMYLITRSSSAWQVSFVRKVFSLIHCRITRRRSLQI